MTIETGHPVSYAKRYHEVLDAKDHPPTDEQAEAIATVCDHSTYELVE